MLVGNKKTGVKLSDLGLQMIVTRISSSTLGLNDILKGVNNVSAKQTQGRVDYDW
jgi:hypothetical protein